MGEEEEPITARLLVKGFVQGVGYRAYVKEQAYRFKLRGTVQNLPDGNVEIYCKAPSRKTFEDFKKNLSNDDNDVEEIEEHLEGSSGYGEGPSSWGGFNVLRDEFSSSEETLEYIALGGRRMLKKQDQLLDRQDQMLDRQDQTLGAIRDVSTKQDETNRSIKEMDGHLNDKFDWLADRYGEFGERMSNLETDMHDIKNDIREMKNAFVKLVDHFTKK